MYAEKMFIGSGPGPKNLIALLKNYDRVIIYSSDSVSGECTKGLRQTDTILQAPLQF